MDFSEHRDLREFDLSILDKKYKQKLNFAQAMQKLKLEYLKAKDFVGDKRHQQRMEYMEKELTNFIKRLETKEGKQ